MVSLRNTIPASFSGGGNLSPNLQQIAYPNLLNFGVRYMPKEGIAPNVGEPICRGTDMSGCACAQLLGTFQVLSFALTSESRKSLLDIVEVRVNPTSTTCSATPCKRARTLATAPPAGKLSTTSVDHGPPILEPAEQWPPALEPGGDESGRLGKDSEVPARA